jgi:hypothetical protein
MSVEPVVDIDISFEWRRWAAIALVRGTPPSEVITTLTANGVPEAAAAVATGRLLMDPALDAGRWAMGHLHKLESMLDIRQQLSEMSAAPTGVARRSGVGRDEFLAEHYAANVPVLLEDVCHDWPALDRWSPEYLVEQIGEVEVEVMLGRGPDPGDEINMEQHRTLMPFSRYVDRVRSTEWSNELYLVANNGLLATDVAQRLWEDFSLDDRYLDPSAPHKDTFIWYGPAGTVTNLHHDVMNILFHQVYGWKHIVLIPPTMTHRVSNSIGVYSDLDPLNADPERHPGFADVRQLHVTIGPGEALFIPVGWWHHVTGLETSISISTTSFLHPNEFDWSNPNMTV